MALAPRPPPQRPHFVAPQSAWTPASAGRPKHLHQPSRPDSSGLSLFTISMKRQGAEAPLVGPPPRPHRPQPSPLVAVCLEAAAMLGLHPRPAAVCLVVVARLLAALAFLPTHLLRRPRRRVAASSTPLSSAPRLSLAGWLRPARGTQHHASPPLRLRRLAASVLLPRVELAVPSALHRLEAYSAPHRRHSEGPPLLRQQHLERALCQPSVRSRCRKSVPQPPLVRRLRSVV